LVGSVQDDSLGGFVQDDMIRYVLFRLTGSRIRWHIYESQL